MWFFENESSSLAHVLSVPDEGSVPSLPNSFLPLLASQNFLPASVESFSPSSLAQ